MVRNSLMKHLRVTYETKEFTKNCLQEGKKRHGKKTRNSLFSVQFRVPFRVGFRVPFRVHFSSLNRHEFALIRLPGTQ